MQSIVYIHCSHTNTVYIHCSHACCNWPQDKTWALSKVVTKAGGAKLQVPVGDACSTCHEFWRQHFKTESAEWDDHVKAFKGQKAYAATVRDAISRSEGNPKGFEPEKVSAESQRGFQVCRYGILVSQCEMRRALGVQRLPKHVGVPIMSVPAENGSGSEDVFVFQDPARPHRSITFVQNFMDTRAAVKLSESSHLWSGGSVSVQNAAAQARASESHEDVLYTKNLKVFGDWVDDYLAKKKEKESNKKDGDAASNANDSGDSGESSSDDSAELVGPAVEAASVTAASVLLGQAAPKTPPSSAKAAAGASTKGGGICKQARRA